jgi:hypothetical protein
VLGDWAHCIAGVIVFILPHDDAFVINVSIYLRFDLTWALNGSEKVESEKIEELINVNTQSNQFLFNACSAHDSSDDGFSSTYDKS